MWDVIVVGARCAGAITALRFARSGRSVLMLDKARAGSDTLSTHGLLPSAIGQLRDLGLLDAVCATGAPPLHSLLIEIDGKAFVSPMEGPADFALGVRRTVLDPILVNAAQKARVVIQHQAAADGLVCEDGRVAGVRYRDAIGTVHTERTRLVVGADGRRSFVAQEAGATEYNNLESGSGAFYAYYHGVGPTVAGTDVFQIAYGIQCETLSFPCDGDLHVVLLGVSPDEFVHINTQGLTAFEDRLRTIPALAPRLAGAERVSKLHPASPHELRGFFRKPYGPGWALVGDAGCHVHPASANGIPLALRSAELLHAWVERAWAENRPAEEYLDEYQRIRDAESIEGYHASYFMGDINHSADPGFEANIPGVRLK